MSLPFSINESVLKERLSELAAVKSWNSRALPTLEATIRTADDYDLFRINPIRYGGTAGLSDADAIELFVHAAKVGLLEMDWQLLCAYCPQIAGSFRELDKVHPRFQCEFCNAINDVALDDYIQVTFTVSERVRDNIFRHPERLSVEDYYLRYHFAKGFIPPHGMTPEQIVAMLSRQFADIEARQQQSFDFDLPADRFEVLDLSHNLLLVFFVEGQPGDPQRLRFSSTTADFGCRTVRRGRETRSWGRGVFRSGRSPTYAPASTGLKSTTAWTSAAVSG